VDERVRDLGFVYRVHLGGSIAAHTLVQMLVFEYFINFLAVVSVIGLTVIRVLQSFLLELLSSVCLCKEPVCLSSTIFISFRQW